VRILVCGSRNWDNKGFLWSKLDEYVGGIGSYDYPDVIIHGAAKGADTMAADWAHSRGIQVIGYPAQWDQFGKAAGPIRNSRMLMEGQPDVVIAFSNDLEVSKGTKHMVTIARKAGIQTIVIGEQSEGQ
jgi:hypothetical protein